MAKGSSYIVVNPEQAKALVRAQMAAPADKRMAIGFIGHMGEGKSQVVQQAPKEAQGWDYIDLRGSQMEATDFLGIPHFDPETKQTVYARPNWWPQDGTKTVLVLEEINRAPLDVQQAVMQVLNERRVGVHKLPDDTAIVICINPPNDQYQVSELDPAFINRAAWYEFRSDVDVWLRYAYAKGIHDDVIRFIGLTRNEGFLSKPVVGEPCPTPRSWEMVSNVLHTIHDQELRDMSINALIGTKAGVTFKTMTAKGFKVPVRGREILDDYKGVAEKIDKQESNENWFTVKDLVACIETEKLPKERLANLVKFFKNAPNEWQGDMINRFPQKVLARMCGADPTLAVQVTAVRGAIEALQAE